MTVEKSTTQETEEIADTNEEGLPCYSDDSEELSNEHDRWRKALKKRVDHKEGERRYWKQMSSCKTL